MTAAAPVVDHYLARFEPGHTRASAPQAEVVKAVRHYVNEVRTYLEKRHRAGDDPEQINQANSDLMDRLVRRLFHLAESAHYAEGGDLEQHFAVIAVGGYARREMSVQSDVDLLLLYAGELTPYIQDVARSVQYRLWDAGLTVGCAVRTIADTLELAGRDATVRTSIIDVRYLIGDAEVFHEFRDALQEHLFSDTAAFIGERTRALRERHLTYGESLYLLQPNVKEGVGGLRDYHTAYWVARAAYPGLRGLDDLLHLGLLTEREMSELRSALRFVWRVRNELHFVSGRRDDRMSFERQEHVADALGYTGRAGAELPVERFMGDYYRHARAIRTASEIVIEQCERRARPAAPRPAPVEVEDGFRLAAGYLEIPHAAHLREEPLRMLRAFAVAQDHDVALSRTALRLLGENLDLVPGLRRDREAAALLERILGSERRVMRSLLAMNEIGLLGRYLPEWEHIVCRWQHVLYHTYTVDVHSVFLVEQLRRLWRGKYERELPVLTALVRRVEDRPVLFLGCLLHDVGKGRGGDHSRKGAALARDCLERLGLAPERIERAVFLVRQHLLMSHLAQRRDLSDPRVIVEFAKTVGDRTNLRNLYLLTFADFAACSPTAWNEWKGHLLGELFERTAEFLETGREDPARAMEQIEARIKRRKETARSELRRRGLSDGEIQSYFDSMVRRYFITHTPGQIARHARVVLDFLPERDVQTAVRESASGVSELLLCARDRAGLYATAAGVLTSLGINILGANVYTMREGLALEVFRLDTPPGDPAERRARWQKVEETLRGALRGEVLVPELLRRRRRPVGAPAPPARRPPKVEISTDESDFYTIVDVAADDRPGLLYDLSRTITDHGLTVYIAKASTILDQVADTFYVKDREGRKPTDPETLHGLRRALLEAAREDDREGSRG